MPESNKLHIANKGINKGRWVACPATQQCRNGGVHITRENMLQLKKQLTQTTGKTVFMNQVTPETAAAFLTQEQEAAEKQDTFAQEAGIDLTTARMDKKLLSSSIKKINTLTHRRSQSLDAARENIISAYEDLKDAPTVGDFTKTMEEEILGKNLETEDYLENRQVYIGLRTNKPELVVESRYAVETEEEYDEVITKLQNQTPSPNSIEAPSWNEIMDGAEWDDYNTAPDDEPYYFSSYSRFTLNNEQTKRYDEARAKQSLTPYYAIAKSKDLPSWALRSMVGDYDYDTNQAVNQLKNHRQVTHAEQEGLQRRLKRIETASRAVAKLTPKVELLKQEIQQAEATQVSLETPVMQRALKDYVANKKAELRIIEGKQKRALATGSAKKLATVKADVAKAKKAAANPDEKENKLWKEAAQSWLTHRFPSTKKVHRKSEAAKWLKTHPEAVTQISEILKTTHSI